MVEKEVIAEVPGFFGTLTPYIIIAVLILAAYAMSFYREEKEEHSSLWKALAVAIPTCLGIAAVIEVLAFKFVGTDAIWLWILDGCSAHSSVVSLRCLAVLKSKGVQ